MYLPFFDWTLILLVPGMLFAFFAQWKVMSTFKELSQVRSSTGRTGRDVAEALLAAHGVSGVRVEPVGGALSDHYDPVNRVLRLSDGVYGSDSVAAMGVAAHEVGHAIQHAQGYAPMRWRWTLLGPANLGSQLAFPLAFAGILFGRAGGFFLDAAILLFTAAVLFHLVTLPVEFDASHRAYLNLQSAGIAPPQEALQAKRVLDAAALTYLASAATALLTLLRLILIRQSRR
jgi:hypothetical protein